MDDVGSPNAFVESLISPRARPNTQLNERPPSRNPSMTFAGMQRMVQRERNSAEPPRPQSPSGWQSPVGQDRNSRRRSRSVSGKNLPDKTMSLYRTQGAAKGLTISYSLTDIPDAPICNPRQQSTKDHIDEENEEVDDTALTSFSALDSDMTWEDPTKLEDILQDRRIKELLKRFISKHNCSELLFFYEQALEYQERWAPNKCELKMDTVRTLHLLAKASSDHFTSNSSYMQS